MLASKIAQDAPKLSTMDGLENILKYAGIKMAKTSLNGRALSQINNFSKQLNTATDDLPFLLVSKMCSMST